MKKNGFVTVLVILILAILGIVGYFALKNYKNTSVIQIGKNLPKIAYINDWDVNAYTNNPNLGTIFLFDQITQKVEPFYHIDKKLLEGNVTNFLAYSPSTLEILVQVNTGILGISLKTKAQRIIFSGKERWMQMLTDSSDSVCFFDENIQKYMRVDLKSLKESPINSPVEGCTKDQSVYDYKNGVLATIVSKQLEPGPTGSSPEENKVVVSRPGNNNKTFFLPITNPIYPVLNTNGFLYINEQDLAEVNSLKNLKQVNLSTGQVSDPTSISSLWEKIQADQPFPNSKLRQIGLSPDGKYFIYTNGSKTYGHDLQNNKEILLGDFHLDAPSSQLDFPWSTDGQYFLLPNDDPTHTILYNMKALTMTKLTLENADATSHFAILQ